MVATPPSPAPSPKRARDNKITAPHQGGAGSDRKGQADVIERKEFKSGQVSQEIPNCRNYQLVSVSKKAVLSQIA